MRLDTYEWHMSFYRFYISYNGITLLHCEDILWLIRLIRLIRIISQCLNKKINVCMIVKTSVILTPVFYTFLFFGLFSLKPLRLLWNCVKSFLYFCLISKKLYHHQDCYWYTLKYYYHFWYSNKFVILNWINQIIVDVISNLSNGLSKTLF